MSKRLKIFFFAAGLVTVVAVLLWPLLPMTSTFKSGKLPTPVAQQNTASENSPYSAKVQSMEIPESIYSEAVRASETDEDPAATELRLNEMAGKLSASEIQALADVVKTPSDQGDLRAVAVDLLARSKSEESLQPLNEIIFSKWPENQDERMNDFERALRTRAVEGVQDNPSQKAVGMLATSCEQMEDKFLSDQSCRAYMHRRGEAGSLKDQHQEALKKIIEN